MVVRRRGAGRTPLVWIHGLGEHSASFDPVVEHAALAGFAHVLVDLPGYGRSPWPDADPAPAASSLDALATHLATWLARQPRAILVGHSMGGVLATLVAERLPAAAVAGVVDIDGNCSRGDCVFSSQALAYSVEDFAAHGFAAMRDRIYEGGLSDRPLRGYHAALCMASPRQFHAHALDLVRLSETETLARRFAALPCPRLYVAGVPRGVCARSRALLDEAAAPWVGLEPAGHWVFLDQLAAFAALVAAFARDVAG